MKHRGWLYFREGGEMDQARMKEIACRKYQVPSGKIVLVKALGGYIEAQIEEIDVYAEDEVQIKKGRKLRAEEEDLTEGLEPKAEEENPALVALPPDRSLSRKGSKTPHTNFWNKQAARSIRDITLTAQRKKLAMQRAEATQSLPDPTTLKRVAKPIVREPKKDDLTPRYIYALVDPRDGQVRYVGQCKNLKTRYAGHLREPLPTVAWVAELKGAAVVPEIRILEVTDAEHVNDCEQKWIQQEAVAQGWKLLNVFFK